MKITNASMLISMDLMMDKYNQLIIENAIDFRTLVGELIELERGMVTETVIMDGYEFVKFKDNIELIVNPLFINPNSTKILKKLYNNLACIVTADDLQLQYMELNGMCNELLSSLDNDSEINFTWNDMLELPQLFKVAGLKVDVGNSDVLIENLVDYINVSNSIMGTKLFIFINLIDYLSSDELLTFMQTARYLNVCILDVQSNEKYDRMGCENNYIIDKDRCVIT